jgi:hypothetical protein
MFRRSVVFALEAEGYVVTSHATLPPQHMGYDCVVLDHRAAERSGREALLGLFQDARIVLLAGRPTPWMVESAFRVVETPQAGNALAAAVSEAVLPPVSLP